MEKILNFISKQTKGTCYKSHKYCYDGLEMPSVVYDDKQNINFSQDRNGETDKGLKTWKSLLELAKKINNKDEPSLFRYFLDGSRKTYKVDDIAYGNRLYPIIAGQIGVGCCERLERGDFKKLCLETLLVISLPECANKDNFPDELFFNNLIQKLNDLNNLKQRVISFNKILHYSDSKLKQGEKYENKGIAKIQDEMVETEKRLVSKLVKRRKLNYESYLLKDGSIEYQKMKTGDYKDLSSMKSNYRCVVGVSKSFNPELCKDSKNKSIAKKIADLPLYCRTPAYKYSTERTPGVEFSVWYVRIRDLTKTISPFDGVVKVEKILVTEKESEHGLDSDEIDRISANIINERLPVCYGSDKRWANHLYPVYLTETFIKSNYLSDLYFLNLF